MKKSSHSPANLLAQMAQIQKMELGKLCSYRRAGRSKDSDTYYRLQIWQEGKNHTRHVRPEELPALEEALEGYRRYCRLSEEYVRLVVAKTRTELEQGIKKKIPPYSRHLRKRSSDSSSP